MIKGNPEKPINNVFSNDNTPKLQLIDNFSHDGQNITSKIPYKIKSIKKVMNPYLKQQYERNYQTLFLQGGTEEFLFYGVKRNSYAIMV